MKTLADKDFGLFESITVRNLVCQYNTCAPEWRETDCRYSFNKLYYIQQGEGEIIIGSDIFPLKPDECYLIPANTVHSYRHNPQNPIIKHWCHFSLSFGEGRQLSYHPETLRCILPSNLGVPVFRQLIQAAGSSDRLDVLMENASLLLLLRPLILNLQRQL